LVKFEDELEDWLPEMEVRDLQILEEYIRSHRDFAKSLKLKVSEQEGGSYSGSSASRCVASGFEKGFSRTSL
jgi:hypothetical protein